MTPSVAVYGFGSAFGEKAEPNDIDLLIIHPRTDAASCRFAIQCKNHLVRHVEHAHLTMLSASEAKHFGILKTARAVLIGTIRCDNWEEDSERLLAEVCVRVKHNTA